MFVALLGAPAHVWATNENRPRTPLGWHAPPCMTTVDRSAGEGPLIELAIPYEDTGRTDDELPDSRTVQLWATCRDLLPGEQLPNWVSSGDVTRVMDAGGLDQTPPDADILDRSDWTQLPGHDGVAGSCALPVLGEDARLPITCEATLPGVRWQLGDVPVGAYILRGYTFEPNNNLWTRRPGVVRVHDGDLAAAGPAAALRNPTRDGRAYLGSPYPLLGCAAGPPGTAVQVAWAPTTADDLGDPAAWTTITELQLDDPVPGEDFEVAFDPPPEAAGQAVLFRVTATTPGGDLFRYHTDAILIVLDQDRDSDPPTISGGPDGCREGAGDGGTAGDTGDTGDTGMPSERVDACACRAGRERAGDGGRGVLALAVLGLGLGLSPGRRRRSSDRRSRRPPGRAPRWEA